MEQLHPSTLSIQIYKELKSIRLRALTPENALIALEAFKKCGMLLRYYGLDFEDSRLERDFKESAPTDKPLTLVAKNKWVQVDLTFNRHPITSGEYYYYDYHFELEVRRLRPNGELDLECPCYEFTTCSTFDLWIHLKQLLGYQKERLALSKQALKLKALDHLDSENDKEIERYFKMLAKMLNRFQWRNGQCDFSFFIDKRTDDTLIVEIEHAHIYIGRAFIEIKGWNNIIFKWIRDSNNIEVVETDIINLPKPITRAYKR